MFGDDRIRLRALGGAACLALVAQAVFGQSGDFGGSFETDAPSVTPEADTIPELPDSFGGSFEEGGDSEVPSATPPPSAEVVSPNVEDGEIIGGTFDPDFGGGAGANTEPVAAEQNPPPEAPSVSTVTIPEEIFAFESRNYGVKPPTRLRQSEFHAPTPNRLPGGFLVSTEALVQAMAEDMEFILIDVLGDEYSLPGAYVEPLMASAGNFEDRIQQQTREWLGLLTDGEPSYPIVIYCGDPMCWLSYNAALRAVNAGYTNVYWYRGGLQAWMMTGLQVVPSGF